MVELISTHIGADFDAFASVLAARRLHPRAAVFFPGSREESVRRLEATGLVSFEEVRQRHVNPGELTRVVLCDSRQRDRIGVVGEWLEARPEIEVLAYDHHPDSETDVLVAGGAVDPDVGSTSTLMVEEYRRRSLTPTPAEATVLLTGVYEDTGSLTFATTSARDLGAAAWLLDQGGDLATVRRFAVQRLDPRRLEILHRMADNLQVERIHGHRVGLVAVELGEFVEELAPLVSRCAEIFDLPLLVACFGEGDAVTVIARGDLPGLDLGELLAGFAGGGGHATAAAARLKETSPLAVRERLLPHLERTLPPAARARELMIAEYYRLPAGTSVEEAKRQINNRRINAAPVVADGDRPVGAVTRQILDAALQHGLGDRPVETVMDRELEWVGAEAPADEIVRRMLTRHPRFVLVGDRQAGRVQGLVTRMAVLRHLHGRVEDDRIDRRVENQRIQRRRVAGLLAEGLSPGLRRRVEAVASVSREHRIPVYLVGGLVRDLLLGRENRDLDLVVEGDGPHFARLLAVELGARVREHQAFMTAVVVDPEGLHVDVATARSEFYRAPAALPEVQTSPLRQDLYRRDFTINTLAIQLGPGRQPELIDYFGGGHDLEAGVLRALHSLSFIDDPTRALRAVRLEQRLGFHIAPETLRLIEVALGEGVFARLSGPRLRDELILLLEEPAVAVRGLERLQELDLLATVHPGLVLTPAVAGRLREAVAAYDWFHLEGFRQPQVRCWRLLLAVLLASLDEARREEVLERLRFSGEDLRLLLECRRRVEEAGAVLAREGLRPHQAAEALDGLAGEELLLVMTDGGEEHRLWVRRELAEMRGLQPAVRGRDLVAAGVPEGPAIGRALQAVRRARLDGEIGPDGERAYALEFLRAAGEIPVAGPGAAEVEASAAGHPGRGPAADGG